MAKKEPEVAPKCPDCGITLFFGPAHNCNPKRLERSSDKPPSEPMRKPKPKAGKNEKRTAYVAGALKPAFREGVSEEKRKEIVDEVVRKTKRLTPHPDCPVCNARRERTREAMRERRGK